MEITLLEALNKIHGYAKFIKDLVIKKRFESFEDVGGLNHFCVITSRSLEEDQENPRAFTISYAIGALKIKWPLGSLGASINLIQLVVYKQLGLGHPNQCL